MHKTLYNNSKTDRRKQPAANPSHRPLSRLPAGHRPTAFPPTAPTQPIVNLDTTPGPKHIHPSFKKQRQSTLTSGTTNDAAAKDPDPQQILQPSCWFQNNSSGVYTETGIKGFQTSSDDNASNSSTPQPLTT